MKNGIICSGHKVSNNKTTTQFMHVITVFYHLNGDWLQLIIVQELQKVFAISLGIIATFHRLD